MIIQIVVAIFLVLIFLFAFWRRLKEDYIGHHIFTSAFYIIVFVTSLISLAHRYFLEYWFWLGLVGVIIGVLLSIYRFRLRTPEVTEAVVVATLPVLFVFFLMYGLFISDTKSLYLACVVLSLFILYLVLNSHYKRFTWYKSGREGFAGVTVIGMFFIVRSLVAMYFPNVISFLPEYEAMASGLIALLSFFSLYLLARY